MNTAELVEAPYVLEEKQKEEHWTETIEPRTRLLDLRLKEVWRYRDLIAMFVRRDFIATYKQTILGPLWFFIQPLLTSITFVIIFGRVAKISTDGMPMMVFYLSGITIWNYFSQTLTATSTIFTANANIFGKVYFPRLTLPLSLIISNLVRFSIQFVLFLCVWLYYIIKGSAIQPNWAIVLTPVLLVLMGLLSLGVGMIFSSMTTKYRDLTMLLQFGIQLLMYATPVIYPLSALPQKYKLFILANPVSPIVETFRYAFLGSGNLSWGLLCYSIGITSLILFFGIITFNKVEKSFMDTV
ncbi:ABC transporter permease [Chitinophagaceae bacterium LB-8]|uniref:Transport permease protein n=1 Tax=Paraflavisolibacter caeni TaxID=2982496 RepID=A0A9X3B9H5_9BACT|nr:ABC transporter permease [Paraflavisolibacter caeni]MCU7551286.1 ABC transporter permease [Paraflavisolibacter caeni]